MVARELLLLLRFAAVVVQAALRSTTTTGCPCSRTASTTTMYGGGGVRLPCRCAPALQTLTRVLLSSLQNEIRRSALQCVSLLASPSCRPSLLSVASSLVVAGQSSHRSSAFGNRLQGPAGFDLSTTLRTSGLLPYALRIAVQWPTEDVSTDVAIAAVWVLAHATASNPDNRTMLGRGGACELMLRIIVTCFVKGAVPWSAATAAEAGAGGGGGGGGGGSGSDGKDEEGSDGVSRCSADADENSLARLLEAACMALGNLLFQHKANQRRAVANGTLCVLTRILAGRFLGRQFLRSATAATPSLPELVKLGSGDGSALLPGSSGGRSSRSNSGSAVDVTLQRRRSGSTSSAGEGSGAGARGASGPGSRRGSGDSNGGRRDRAGDGKEADGGGTASRLDARCDSGAAVDSKFLDVLSAPRNACICSPAACLRDVVVGVFMQREVELWLSDGAVWTDVTTAHGVLLSVITSLLNCVDGNADVQSMLDTDGMGQLVVSMLRPPVGDAALPLSPPSASPLQSPMGSRQRHTSSAAVLRSFEVRKQGCLLLSHLVSNHPRNQTRYTETQREGVEMLIRLLLDCRPSASPASTGAEKDPVASALTSVSVSALLPLVRTTSPINVSPTDAGAGAGAPPSLPAAMQPSPLVVPRQLAREPRSPQARGSNARAVAVDKGDVVAAADEVIEDYVGDALEMDGAGPAGSQSADSPLVSVRARVFPLAAVLALSSPPDCVRACGTGAASVRPVGHREPHVPKPSCAARRVVVQRRTERLVLPFRHRVRRLAWVCRCRGVRCECVCCVYVRACTMGH